MTDDAPTQTTPAVSREQMRLVLDISRSLAVTPDLDVLLVRIARACTALLSCERASVFLHDARKDELWTTVALQSNPIRVPGSSGIVGTTFRTNQIIHCPDAYADPRFNPEPDRESGFITRDLLAAPMVDLDAKPVGVLQAVNKISGPFSETDSALLRLLADQAGVAIQRWNLQQQAIASSALQHEMELARRVQEQMIPKHPPELAGLRCAGWTRPASINGGDCYDLWISNGRLAVFVADASGHGMAPALVVSQVRALVRALSETEQDPLKILLRINERLAADLEPGRFVTAFLGFVSGSGLLHWCSAGHSPIILCQPGMKPVVWEPSSPPLGLMQHVENPALAPVQLEPGGSLIVLSDGISEAFNANGDLFEIENVLTALTANSCSDPDSVIATLRDAVVRWQGREEPADDQTIVVVRREG